MMIRGCVPSQVIWGVMKLWKLYCCRVNRRQECCMIIKFKSLSSFLTFIWIKLTVWHKHTLWPCALYWYGEGLCLSLFFLLPIMAKVAKRALSLVGTWTNCPEYERGPLHERWRFIGCSTISIVTVDRRIAVCIWADSDWTSATWWSSHALWVRFGKLITMNCMIFFLWSPLWCFMLPSAICDNYDACFIHADVCPQLLM